MKKVIQNAKGGSFILVLMVMAVLSILGAMILTISLSETKQTVYQDKVMQAYYLARSGADSVATYIVGHPKQAQTLISAPESDSNNELGNGTFKVDVQPGVVANEINVCATGTVGNVQNTVRAVLRKLGAWEILDKAIYSDGALDITGMEVSGDVQSAGNIVYSNNGSNAYYGTPYSYSPRELLLADFPTPPQYTAYTMPATHTLTVKNTTKVINSSCTIDNVVIDNNGYLNVAAGSGTVQLVVNNLTVKNELNISASGTGRVELYVNNLMCVTTTGAINNDAPAHLFVYLKSGSKFEIQANMLLNGYIIGPDATVEVQSNGSTINGAVFANVLQKNDVSSSVNGAVNYVPLPTGTDLGDSMTEYRHSRWEK